VLCFFFHTKDDIRDDLVTGVQTCALPISSQLHGADLLFLEIDPPPLRTVPVFDFLEGERGASVGAEDHRALHLEWISLRPVERRSEERRVGKYGRSRI